MPNLAQRVAELIDADAHSGRGAWDEVNGPDAELISESDTKQIITIPERWIEGGDSGQYEETDNYCRITIEYVEPRT